MNATGVKRHIPVETERLLLAAVALAKQNAERFNMDLWVKRPGDLYRYERTKEFLAYHSECGTTLCYASWILSLASAEFFASRELSYISVDAAEFAGLGGAQAYRLFFVSEWPSAYMTAYESAETPEQLVDALERRVSHFIRTGE